MTRRAALLVDGDNVSAAYQDEIHKIGTQFGRLDIVRVFLNAQINSLWHDATAYRLVHTGTGKNATDLMLAIDAMEFALRGNIEVMVIASSDGDFVHLHHRLREYGLTTVGIGEAKAPGSIRGACSEFIELSSAPNRKQVTPANGAGKDLDCKIRKIIAANSVNGAGMRLTILGAKMHRQYSIKISEHKERTWRGYLSARPNLYDLDPAGPDAHVRFKPEGFARQH